jgi:hypothetical protein
MPPKKPAPAPASSENQMVFYALMAVMLVFVVIPTVISFFGVDTDEVDLINSETGEKAYVLFTSFIEGLSFVSVFISFIFILGIIYVKLGYKEIALAYNQQLSAKDSMLSGSQKVVVNTAPKSIYASSQVEDINGALVPNALPAETFTPDRTVNPKWEEIERHMQSYAQSEWRVAILEADILLYDMLSQMGFEGNSIGEMLKQADKSTFITLDEAWKAHKIRNIIAHEGANYELTKDEADRAIRLYKKVFEEFYFI